MPFFCLLFLLKKSVLFSSFSCHFSIESLFCHFLSFACNFLSATVLCLSFFCHFAVKSLFFCQLLVRFILSLLFPCYLPFGYTEEPRNSAFQGTRWFHALLREMPYCQYIELKEKAFRNWKSMFLLYVVIDISLYSSFPHYASSVLIWSFFLSFPLHFSVLFPPHQFCSSFVIFLSFCPH